MSREVCNRTLQFILKAGACDGSVSKTPTLHENNNAEGSTHYCGLFSVKTVQLLRFSVDPLAVMKETWVMPAAS